MGRAKFCPECGVPLSVAKLDAVTSASVGQRRQLTVMFCDLAGSTALAERLDPEDLHNVLALYQETVSQAIGRFGGHVAKYLGDGLVVFFGFPAAHEDDPCRAVLAGLEILKDMARLNGNHGFELAVRVGIHTGLVVASEIGGQGDVTGETPNIAARLQEVAELNSVVVSAATQRIAEAEFQFESLGPKMLKGLSRPIEVYRPVRRREMLARQVPMLGRDVELRLLSDRWSRVSAGSGQIVLLCGEAGIGKSRLVGALREHAEGGVFEIACSAYEQGTPFHPVVKALERELRGTLPEDRVFVLTGILEAQGANSPDGVALLASLLSIPDQPAITFSPEAQRQRTLELLLQVVIGRSVQKPLLLIAENVHWADPSTSEFLGLLLEQIAGTKVMALLTFRPHFVSPWPTRGNMLHLSLDRLDPQPARAIIERIAGGQLPEPVVMELLRKTDGVPLFVEELTKMVLESELLHRKGEDYHLAGPLPELAIPTTLQDSLMARLDRLSTVKDVVQLASVLGREFTRELLSAVSDDDEHVLAHELRRLVSAEIIHETRSADGTISYRFKHALIQDAAYESLLKSHRQLYHRKVASVIVDRFPEIAESKPELLALHYSAAGDAEQATACWFKAGERALGRSANREAVAHFERALEGLESLPEGPERLGQELGIQANLGIARVAIEGFASESVGRTFSRAEEICGILGESSPMVPVLWGLWAYHLVRADLPAARRLAERILEIGRETGEMGLIIEGHFTLSNVQFWSGELSAARESLEQVVELYDLELCRAHSRLYGQDPGVTALCYLAFTLTFMGFPDEAIRRADEAVALAKRVDHAHSTAWALGCSSQVRMWLGDIAGVVEAVEASGHHAQEEASAYWHNVSVVHGGWALFWQGDCETGLSEMVQGERTLEAIGSEVVLPIYLTAIAEAQIAQGNFIEAAATVAEGLQKTQCHGLEGLEIDLRRLEAQLSPPDVRPSLLLRAQSLAQKCGARAPGLRVALDLAKCLERERAREVLQAAIADWPEVEQTRSYGDVRAYLND